MLLDGRTILVSGAGPGLGRACARLALRDGANVVMTARSGGRLAALAAELDPTGDRVLAQAADITDQDACTSAADAAVERFGGLDAVVNVAAIDTRHNSFDELTDGDWKANLEINVIGTVHVVRAVVPHMRARGGGSIVIIGSQASLRPVRVVPQSAYGASKAALLSVARDMAAELGPDGIRVNTVIPTWMWGPNVELYCQWQAGERGITADEVKAEIASTMALREMPNVDDVAEAVVFFASDRARMITGQSLLVNAGEMFPVA